MRAQQVQPSLHVGFIPFYILTFLFYMTTPVAATPYEISIESPGEYLITGSFDSDFDTWNSPTDITNWSFTASIVALPVFGVGPLSQAGGATLNAFQGSTTSGIELLDVGAFNAIIEFVPFRFDPAIASAGFDTDTGGNFAEFRTPYDQLNNTANQVPEPTTLLLLGSGLAGLAGYRLQQARRKTN